MRCLEIAQTQPPTQMRIVSNQIVFLRENQGAPRAPAPHLARTPSLRMNGSLNNILRREKEKLGEALGE